MIADAPRDLSISGFSVYIRRVVGEKPSLSMQDLPHACLQVETVIGIVTFTIP